MIANRILHRTDELFELTESELQKENRELRERLARTRTLKLKYEEDVSVLKSKLKAAYKTCAGRIQEVEKYAAQCQAMYDKTLEVLQKIIVQTFAGQKVVTHICPNCCKNLPIYKFNVRVAYNSKSIIFAAYCQDCEERKGEKASMPLGEAVENFCDRAPKIADQLVDLFTEEAESV